jgi:hypothetical protein
MDSFDPFYHLEDFKLLVCKTCGYAVLRPHIERHLKEKHKDLSSTQRSNLVATLSQLPVLETAEEALDMRLPDFGQPALPHLPVQNGYQCTLCNDYVGGSPKSMQRHYQSARHSWRKPRGAENPWRQVQCQRFFSWGGLIRYYAVTADPQPTLDAIRTEHAEEWEARSRQLRADQAQAQAHICDAAPLEVNPWLERTGWASHLEGRSTTAMAALVAAPVEGSPHAELLKRTGRLFDLVMRQSFRTARPAVCDVEPLKIVNSLEAGKVQTKALQIKLKRETLQRYTEVWKRLLYYILRTQYGDEPPLLYRLTGEQSAALQRYLRAVEQCGPEVDELEVGPTTQRRPATRSPSRQLRAANSAAAAAAAAAATTATTAATPAAEGTSLADAPVSLAVATAATELLEFCIALLDDKLDLNVYKNAVVSGLAVIGIEGDGWTAAHNYTPKLSAVIKVAQLMVVQHACELKWSGRAASAFDEIKSMTMRFLQTGTNTPIPCIYDLRGCGMAISKGMSAQGTVEWVGETLQYRTFEFSMSDFRDFVRKLIGAAHRQLNEELLMLKGPRGRPRARIDELEDNPAESGLGWSFVKDERNGWLAEGPSWLRKRVLDNFHNDWFAAGPGLPFKMARVKAYMASLSRFMDRLLVLMHVTGGQPARSTELLSIRYCNTATGSRRNIFVEKGLVVYVTEYHKG